MTEFKSSFQKRKKNGEYLVNTKTMAQSSSEQNTNTLNLPYSDNSSSEDLYNGTDNPVYSNSLGGLRDSSTGSYRSGSGSHEPNTPTDTEILQKRPTTLQDSVYLPQSTYGLSSNMESSLIRNIPNFRTQKLNEDVLQSLLEEEKIIIQRIQDLAKIHGEILSKGSSSRKVRLGMLSCFRSLNQLYEAISEIYGKEAERKIYTVSQFEERSHTKNELLNEIEQIRDVTKGEGFRLNQLLSEKKSVDEEAESLERRLQQLKEKKALLKVEIEQSESIIESRASSYLEALREVEEEDKIAIVELAEERSITSMKNVPNERLSINSLLAKMSLLKNTGTELTPETVLNTLRLQVQSFEDNSERFKEKEEKFHENYIILENASDLLDDLEKELAVIVKTQNLDDPMQTKEKIINALQQTYSLLHERKASFRNMAGILEQIIGSEMSTIKSGLDVMGYQLQQAEERITNSPLSNRRSPTPKMNIHEPTVSTSPPTASIIMSSGSSQQPKSLQDLLKQNLKFNQNDAKLEKKD